MDADQLFQRYRDLQDYIGWTAEDAERVRSLAPAAREHFTNLIDDFYAAIGRNPATMKVITGGTNQIARLKGTLIGWLQDLFSGCYDKPYVLRRWKVGLRHVEIGLDQVYTNAALSRLRAGLLSVLSGHDQEAQRSLNKLLDLDLAIIEDAYQLEMRRRQQRIERLATIGQVAGGIAHELRNPLNVIKTSVYYLRTARNISPDKAAAHLERIDRQAAMADGVIGALNNFARLPVPELKPMPLRRLIDEVFEVSPLPDAIAVKIDLPDSLPDVLVDGEQLKIVLTNLARNARDAMPGGGTLTFSGGRCDGFVEITVRDTGMGIPSENLGRIMEPLFSTKARGIGLGLAISRAIVEKHNGQLKVRSEMGQGTTFTLRLLTSQTESAACSDGRPAANLA